MNKTRYGIAITSGDSNFPFAIVDYPIAPDVIIPTWLKEDFRFRDENIALFALMLFINTNRKINKLDFKYLLSKHVTLLNLNIDTFLNINE